MNAAMSQAVQPVPATFRAPRYRMGTAPSMEMMRYRGGMAFSHRLAVTAFFS